MACRGRCRPCFRLTELSSIAVKLRGVCMCVGYTENESVSVRFCADGPATMPSPARIPTRLRRSSHEGVVQVPTISRASVTSSDSGTPSAMAGNDRSPYHDHLSSRALYPLPEAGESRASMLAGAVEAGAASVDGPFDRTSEEEVDAGAQQFHSIEGTPRGQD